MSNKSILLGVNIDHVATLRQARAGRYPEPLQAAHAAIEGGADAITVHLREDRRHIQDADVLAIKAAIPVRLNFEMAASDEMLAFALALKPSDCCLVPERRAELTTEGGLDVAGQTSRLRDVVARLTDAGIRVSLFIDPSPAQIDATVAVGAPVIELHTGEYSHATHPAEQQRELTRLRDAVTYAVTQGLQVNAGHGLDYNNVTAVAALPEIRELNIGHSIVSRAVFVGLRNAVAEMDALMQKARKVIAE